MMIFNPNKMFSLRGIEKPYSFLTRHGFASTTASDLINIRKPYVKTVYLERLCLLLNCTPNDLYEWKPSENLQIAANHPLKTLQKQEVTPMSELVKDIPVEKLAKVQELLRELKNEE